MSTETAQENGRRRHRRFPLEARAHLHSGSDRWETELLDISIRGILLEQPEDWTAAVGDEFCAEIELEGGVRINMNVSVAHAEDQRIGFHCDRIDMASFTHLKRLVELNLGDSSLLNRELEALG